MTAQGLIHYSKWQLNGLWQREKINNAYSQIFFFRWTNIKRWKHTDFTLWSWCALDEVHDMKLVTIFPLLVFILAGKITMICWTLTKT